MAPKKTETPRKKRQALDAKRLNAFAYDPEALTIIGLDTKDGKEHPLYDKRVELPVNEALAKNIRVRGVIHAIKVRKNGDVVEVVDGRQRVRAARLANKWNDAEGCERVLVPVMLERGTDTAMMGVMISANEHRAQDLFSSKLDKLERYIALGRTEKDAAVEFGVNKQTIKNWLLVLEAGPAVKKALDQGLLAPTAAAAIAKLPRGEQASAVAEATKDGKATGAVAERVRKERATGQKVRTAPKKALLKKLAQSVELPTAQMRILRWALGEIDASEVPGLPAILKSLGLNPPVEQTTNGATHP